MILARVRLLSVVEFLFPPNSFFQKIYKCQTGNRLNGVEIARKHQAKRAGTKKYPDQQTEKRREGEGGIDVKECYRRRVHSAGSGGGSKVDQVAGAIRLYLWTPGSKPLGNRDGVFALFSRVSDPARLRFSGLVWGVCE